LIEQLVDHLRGRVDDLGWEDVADVIWLAAYLPAPKVPDQPSSPGGTDTNVKPPLPGGASESPPPEPIKPPKAHAPAPPPTTESSAQVRLPSPSRKVERPAGRGVPIRVARPAALRDPLGIGRALRPLTIRVPEPRDSVLDEEATVRIAADVDLWLPVLKPGAARAFDLALVIDTSPSMAAWLDVLRELRRVLEQLGAFRDVGVWRLLAGPAPTDRLALAPGDGPPTCYDPSVLRDPAGRRLILIASDCAAAPWRDNRARKLIATWGRTQPVAILQTLPLPFWRQTGLGFSSAVEVRAPRLGSPTAFLKAEFPAPDDAPEDDSVPTPILWLDDAPLASWARMLTRPGASSTAHWIEPQSLDPTAARAAGMELPAEERVVRFARNASKIAQELAASLAVAPLTMPVIRLVQRTRRPPADDLYLAEVLLGGLMKVTSQSDETHNPTFEFHEGVRKRLLDRLGPARSLEVITAVSRYLVAHHGSTLDFAAIIDDPEGFLDRPTGEQDLPFAHITAMFLRRLGDRYTRIADRLEGIPNIPDTSQDRPDSITTAPDAVRVELLQIPEDLEHWGLLQISEDPEYWVERAERASLVAQLTTLASDHVKRVAPRLLEEYAVRSMTSGLFGD